MKVVESKRRFLKAGAALLALPSLSRAGVEATSLRTLSFRHTHTGEALALAYAAGNAYLDEALGRINWFLRDFRSGRAHAIDPALLDQLHRISQVTGSRAPFEVISAYRSAETNEMLRRTGGGGVASRSLHLEGRAIDIRLGDVGLADLRDAAASLRAGGVGFYPQSRFVHVDTGGVRRW